MSTISRIKLQNGEVYNVGTQSNWNENDSTSISHIKNRPFYSDGDKVVQIDEKYIPDTIARKAEIKEIEAGTGLKISAQDDNKQAVEIDTDVIFVLYGGTSTDVL